MGAARREGRKLQGVRFCSDSLSLIMALSKGHIRCADPLTRRIWDLLIDIARDIDGMVTVQWVPGHCGLEGNVAADEVARQGCSLPQGSCPLDFTTAYSQIRSKEVDKWRQEFMQTMDNSGIATYRAIMKWDTPWPKKRKDTASRRMINIPPLPRQDQRIISQLRSGISTILGSSRKLLHLDDSDICDQCTLGVPQDLNHLINTCPALAEARDFAFEGLPANVTQGLRLLATHPRRILRMLKRNGGVFHGIHLGVDFNSTP